MEAELAAVTQEADDLRQQLRAANDAGEDRSFELTRLELQKAELTRFLTVTMEANRTSVGTPEDVTEFLVSKAGFSACDRNTLLHVMDACRRRDATGLKGIHFSVLPFPGSALPPIPPADDSPIVLPALSEPPVPPAIQARRSGAGAGLISPEPGSTSWCVLRSRRWHLARLPPRWSRRSRHQHRGRPVLLVIHRPQGPAALLSAMWMKTTRLCAI
jgi:hypothetical protein